VRLTRRISLSSLTFAEYQAKCMETTGPIEHLNQEEMYSYLVAGLASEAGEVAGQYKKYLREGGEDRLDSMISELGDVMWYCAVLSLELLGNDYAMEQAATRNMTKLADRKQRGTLCGDGDDR